MTIRLPVDAHGYDYEDQVCALLLAHGYYLETRLVLRKGTEEVLEFDAIATPVNDYQSRKVVEVKSGRWGIADIFKLYGQVMYTDESEAWLIHKKEATESKQGAISELAEHVPVSTINVNIGAESGTLDIPASLELPEETAHTIFISAWWAQSAERIAQSRFRNWCKSHDEPPEVILAAQSYLSAMADCLFQPTPIKRVDALYDAYKEAPKLTSSLIDHVSRSSGDTLKQVRQSVAENDGRPHLQYAMAQEYRARVAILKNAYDAILGEAEHRESKQQEFSWEAITKALLPDSFKAGMDALRAFPHPEHIPYFYQVFVEVFGGFYIPGEDREIEFLSKATGIPEEQVPAAMELFDAFFPIPNGWIHQGDGLNFLKGLPAYLRGAGCFTRQDLYGDKWGEQFPQIQWQITNWHNALYRLLVPSLKVEE